MKQLRGNCTAFLRFCVIVGFTLSLIGSVQGAAALTACTAQDIITQDPANCPAAGLCTIKKSFDVGDGCILDFTGRNLTIANLGQLNAPGTTMTVKAANFIVGPGGYIDARGSGASPPNDRGGVVIIDATGAVRPGHGIGKRRTFEYRQYDRF